MVHAWGFAHSNGARMAVSRFVVVRRRATKRGMSAVLEWLTITARIAYKNVESAFAWRRAPGFAK
ncbi:hypothetical protein [Azoarcus sp. DN11]|uniref:hypothetical protein n=1 Tax=Azoarcus sp. DN11 TaxID=356837 RepID=UPI000FE2063A|nr:hypothetical protein [Azoarcus sp. DN11]